MVGPSLRSDGLHQGSSRNWEDRGGRGGREGDKVEGQRRHVDAFSERDENRRCSAVFASGLTLTADISVDEESRLSRAGRSFKVNP